MDDIDLDISNLKRCLDLLKECLNDYGKNKDAHIKKYIEDACVKRFEYTVETSWKLMKKYLKLEYGKSDKELTMNNIFRLMEGYGFIKSWQDWRNYYNKRNDTSHEYNQLKAQNLINESEKLIKDGEYLYNQLSEGLK